MVLVFADGRYTERIKAGCLMAGQSVFMIEVSKGGQGGTPLPTTSLQTKSESVIVGLHTFKECCVMASPCLERRAKWQKTIRRI